MERLPEPSIAGRSLLKVSRTKRLLVGVPMALAVGFLFIVGGRRMFQAGPGMYWFAIFICYTFWCSYCVLIGSPERKRARKKGSRTGGVIQASGHKETGRESHIPRRLIRRWGAFASAWFIPVIPFGYVSSLQTAALAALSYSAAMLIH